MRVKIIKGRETRSCYEDFTRRLRTEKKEWNDLTEQVLDACVEVHRHLGRGLLESVYEECLVLELLHNGRLPSIPLKLDLLIEGTVVVELKAIERTLPVHVAQLVTYLKLAEVPVGLLVNFNVPLLKEGIRRVVRPDLIVNAGAEERWGEELL